MSTPIETLRAACLKRGVCGIKSIGRTFRTFDDNGSKSLDRNEFKEGLKEYGVQMSASDVDQLFSSFDKDNTGTISFDEFLIALRPPMSASRLKLVDMAFAKMDASGDGVITIQDLKAKYDVTHHEKYKSGEWSAEKILQEFLNNFQAGSTDETVTKEEWLNYYAGVSSSIDEDVYFDFMMRQAWRF